MEKNYSKMHVETSIVKNVSFKRMLALKVLNLDWYRNIIILRVVISGVQCYSPNFSDIMRP